MVLKKPI